jgi:hypothetical protein
MLTEFRSFDPAALLRKADRWECVEFVLLAAYMIPVIAAAFAVSLYVTFDGIDWYLAISTIAAGGCLYRARLAWRHSRLSSFDRTQMEERRLARILEQEEAAAARPAHWFERIAKAEAEFARIGESMPRDSERGAAPADRCLSKPDRSQATNS